MNGEDVLRVETVVVGDRVYRKQSKPARPALQQPVDAIDESKDEEEEDTEADGNANEAIKTLEKMDGTTLYHCYVECDETLLGFVIGKRGKHIEAVQRDCGVQIDTKQKSGYLFVQGNSLQGVASARTRLQVKIADAINSPRTEYSHFLCIPLHQSDAATDVHAKVKQNVEQLSDNTLQSALVDVHKLHLTLCMLKLYTHSSRQKAMHAIDAALQQIPAANITTDGIDMMNDDPSETRVLHLRVHDDDGVLHSAAEKLKAELRLRNLLLDKDDEQPLNLHCTLLSARKANVDAIDVRAIPAIEAGRRIPVQEVHLSQRFVDADSDGFYHRVKVHQLQAPSEYG